MIIIGAGNLGKHILDQLLFENYSDEIIFFDDNYPENHLVCNRFRVINNLQSLKNYFSQTSNKCIVGIGHPRVREKITKKITEAGGVLTTIISKESHFSNFSETGAGTIIQPGCAISHNTKIGESAIIHAKTLIGHDVKIGNYFSCGSNTNILSPAEIGNYCTIGANVLILPKIKIGNQAIIGAGAVVDRDISDFGSFTIK